MNNKADTQENQQTAGSFSGLPYSAERTSRSLALSVCVRAAVFAEACRGQTNTRLSGDIREQVAGGIYKRKKQS